MFRKPVDEVVGRWELFRKAHNSPLSTRGFLQNSIKNSLGFLQDPFQVGLAFETLCIEFIDVLRPRGPGGKPSVRGYHLQTADGTPIARGSGQFGQDGLTG